METLYNLSEILEYCSLSSRIYIYGAGNHGKRMAAFLRQNSINPTGFVVSDLSGNDTKFRGIPIMDVNEISNQIDASYLVCVSENNHKAIRDTLAQRGIANYRILSCELMNTLCKENDWSHLASVKQDGFIQVLMFHRVIKLEHNPWRMAVSPDLFDEYMRHIKENYRLMRFDEDWSEVREKSIVVTLDDGYADNYWNALPILEKYQIPATIFVSSENIGLTREFWWDRLTRLIPTDELRTVRDKLKFMEPDERGYELDKIEKRFCTPENAPSEEGRAMNEEELKRLADSEYITIGGHTVSHGALAGESSEMQKWEITDSKLKIEKIIGRPVTVFSYPFGQRDTYTAETINMLKSVGYIRAAATCPGVVTKETPCYEIPRNGQPDYSLDDFARALEEKWYFYGS
ncbi:polysaccharide deacetylase family protein [Selenomonas ruminantium]|uniref:polysaccharide deacetylase family protein n=1 Tax=Selenomonas ruminantium TaxID=971 RepID=UPI00047CD4D4|nr:polysaccharide deacetylase family protein [Selenomonas ruminantium]